MLNHRLWNPLSKAVGPSAPSSPIQKFKICNYASWHTIVCEDFQPYYGTKCANSSSDEISPLASLCTQEVEGLVFALINTLVRVLNFSSSGSKSIPLRLPTNKSPTTVSNSLSWPYNTVLILHDMSKTVWWPWETASSPSHESLTHASHGLSIFQQAPRQQYSHHSPAIDLLHLKKKTGSNTWLLAWADVLNFKASWTDRRSERCEKWACPRHVYACTPAGCALNGASR